MIDDVVAIINEARKTIMKNYESSLKANSLED